MSSRFNATQTIHPYIALEIIPLVTGNFENAKIGTHSETGPLKTPPATAIVLKAFPSRNISGIMTEEQTV